MTTVKTTRGALVVVTPVDGLKFRAQVRGHEVITDQPVAAGGADSAPSPLELVGVALASCIALYVAQFCNPRQITTEGLRVEVDQETAKSPYRVARYSVKLALPDGFPEEYRAAVQRVAESCAVHNTLSHAPDIIVEYSRAA